MKLKFLRFKKISWKLTIIYSLIFSLVLILLNAGILYGVRYFLVQQAKNQVESSYRITSKNIIGSENEQTGLTDPELLNESDTNSDINIKIADTNGNIVNDSRNFDTKEFSLTKNLDSTVQIESSERHIVLKNVAVNNNGKLIAYLQVAKNMEKEYAFIKLLFFIMVVADAFGIIISVFVGFIISKRILKPIDRITKAAKEITASDLNRLIDPGVADDELARLAVTFNDMIERIRGSFEEQNQFVSDASHELRTPISVIQGYINLIDRWGKEKKEVLQESIDAIKNETANMGELVEKLLFIARGDVGRINLNREYFNTSELAEEVIRESQFITPDHNLSYQIDDKIQLNADRKMIKQLLRALIDNSIKFTPKTGVILIKAETEQGRIKIEVKDTGIGIPKEELDNIFNRFYRIDKARTKELGGSGLGLAIVKRIVDAHGGSIHAESVLGEGTSIIVFL